MRTRHYVSPRKKGSGWAATNKARAERLIADGRMTPAGLAVIDQAMVDGSWTLLDASEQAIVPDDLTAAFDAHSSQGHPRVDLRRQAARDAGHARR